MKALFKKNKNPQPVDPYAQQVTAEAIRILFNNTPSVVLSTLVMIVVMAFIMWGKVNQLHMVIWATLAVVLLSIFLGLSLTFIKRKPAMSDTVRWGHYFTFLQVISGSIWGSITIIFFVPDSIPYQVFIFTSVVGIATATIINGSYWIESFYAFNIPLLTLSGIRLLMEGSAEYKGLAALTMLLLALSIQMAHESKKSVLSAIRLRFENLDLIEKLHKEKEKAEISSRDKTRFLASASHDLRQPVHALSLFADALQTELQGEKSKSLFGSLKRSIEAINQLLSSLLDISKLDANIVLANPEHFSLSHFFSQLDAEYAPQARAKGLGWQMEDCGLFVYSDRALLEVMLRNLISNAIRYTQNGQIAVNCRRLGAEIFIEISDTGIGIPEDQKKEIFREFYQLENKERDRSKGLGLGLAIVERVAALLNHRIELNSELGKGSKFSIILPVGNPEEITVQPTFVFDGQRDINGMKILVIDDEVDVRKGMQAVLESWGCTVILADSETEALDKMHDSPPPHTIIADYRLRDGKTGTQAIELIRGYFNTSIPSLIITGDTDPERLREAQESGHTLMHKPLQPGMLRTYLRRVQRRKA